MSESDLISAQPIELVRPIESVVTQMIGTLESTEDFQEKLDEKFRAQMEQDKLGEFRHWLEHVDAPANRESWIESLRTGQLDKATGTALGCLQVAVLAYLPGPRCFEGAYIYSRLHSSERLSDIKRFLHIPYLSGAVGWMTAYLLNKKAGENNPSYVAVQDAQLDLRGRVASSDLLLGNRSVVGFPISTKPGNEDIASISGFVLITHPVPYLFPDDDGHDVIAKAFEGLRRKHETSLANAVENYLLRSYSKKLLTDARTSPLQRSTPLLPLSEDDPTGFLAAILFKSDLNGRLSAECHVNEDSFLEANDQYMRIASLYPEQWAPPFQKHMVGMAELIQEVNFGPATPLAWYVESGDPRVEEFYPPGKIDQLSSFMEKAGKTVTWSQWNSVRAVAGKNRIIDSLKELNDIYAAQSNEIYQPDLVVPVWNEEDGSRHPLGFFRINCDASSIVSALPAADEFKSLWMLVEDIHRDLNPCIGDLLFRLENQYADLFTTGLDVKLRRDAIQNLKVWLDISHLIADWLAKGIHWLLDADRTSSGVAKPAASLFQLEFALHKLAEQPRRELKSAFEKCHDLWTACENKYRTRVRSISGISLSFVSFWPYLKFATIKGIRRKGKGSNPSAEDQFAELLLDDPGLLRVASILALALSPRTQLNLSERPNVLPDWHGIDLGVPVTTEIEKLTVSHVAGENVFLDFEWRERAGKKHHLQLSWNHEEGKRLSRALVVQALSLNRGAVATRLGKNILAQLNLRYSADGQKKLEEQPYKEDLRSLSEFIEDVGERSEFARRLKCLEHSLLSPQESTADPQTWRVILLSRRDNGTFLAALCDRKVQRPTVLAFRNFALANARAVFLARAYDAQEEAVEEYSRNISAVSHGYKGPIKRLETALGQIRATFNDQRDAVVLSDKLAEFRDMLRATRTLANDAIFYAWRKNRPYEIKPEHWRRKDGRESLESSLQIVIMALNLPGGGDVTYSDELSAEVAETIKINSFFILWRHLLAKLIENGIEHCDVAANPDGPKVKLRAVLESEDVLFQIRNSVRTETMADQVRRVRDALVQGTPRATAKYERLREYGLTEPDPHTQSGPGFGLTEACKCCRLLKIDAQVAEDLASSELVISLRLGVTR